MKVWVVESGEYEQRSVSFVASSPEVALGEIKRLHPLPNEIEWRLDRERKQIIGTAERFVMNHHVAGEFVYDLTEEEVVGLLSYAAGG